MICFVVLEDEVQALRVPDHVQQPHDVRVYETAEDGDLAQHRQRYALGACARASECVCVCVLWGGVEGRGAVAGEYCCKKTT